MVEDLCREDGVETAPAEAAAGEVLIDDFEAIFAACDLSGNRGGSTRSPAPVLRAMPKTCRCRSR